jgi:hypothetical protein
LHLFVFLQSGETTDLIACVRERTALGMEPVSLFYDNHGVHAKRALGNFWGGCNPYLRHQSLNKNKKMIK